MGPGFESQPPHHLFNNLQDVEKTGWGFVRPLFGWVLCTYSAPWHNSCTVAGFTAVALPVVRVGLDGVLISYPEAKLRSDASRWMYEKWVCDFGHRAGLE